MFGCGVPLVYTRGSVATMWSAARLHSRFSSHDVECRSFTLAAQ
jgi:hypothetical protein